MRAAASAARRTAACPCELSDIITVYEAQSFRPSPDKFTSPSIMQDGRGKACLARVAAYGTDGQGNPRPDNGGVEREQQRHRSSCGGAADLTDGGDGALDILGVYIQMCHQSDAIRSGRRAEHAIPLLQPSDEFGGRYSRLEVDHIRRWFLRIETETGGVGDSRGKEARMGMVFREARDVVFQGVESR